jgi:hypothetical protein
MPADGELPVFVCAGNVRYGLAFFLDDQHLLTCAHVVAKSLGLKPTAETNPEEQ